MKTRLIFVLFLLLFFMITIVGFIGYKKEINKNNQTLVGVEDLKIERDFKKERLEESKKVSPQKVEEEVKLPELISLGEYKLTAYCPCTKCCGKWSGSPTASGVMPTTNHTIAVDTSVIPFGTEIVIDDITYVAEDTGSAIKGNKIDIYMSSHEEALEFGVQHKEVFKLVK